MIDAPLAWAFTAGLVATVNPCGFAMLPAYLSYFLGRHPDGAEPDRAARSGLAAALLTGATVSLGFLLVFGAVGTLVSFGLRSVVAAVPWLSIVIGAALALLGVALITGFRLSLALPQLPLLRGDRGLPSMFLFGISYAIASLSCTLPIFLAVVAGTITRLGFASGLVTFLAYGIGMTLVLLALTLAIALAREAVVDRIRGARRYVGPASGVLLLVAGSYIVYYWVLALATEPGSGTASGPSSAVSRLSARAAELLASNPYAVGAASASSLLAVVAYLTVRSERRRRIEPGRSSREGDGSPANDAASSSPVR